MSLIAELRTRADYEADRPSGWRAGNAEKFREAATQLEAMQAEIERLRSALVDHNDALRSACQVADRDGEETNWLTLRGHLHWILAEHHEITNEARASLDNSKEGEK